MGQTAHFSPRRQTAVGRKGRVSSGSTRLSLASLDMSSWRVDPCTGWAAAGLNDPFTGTRARRAPAARPPRLPAVRLDAYRACSGVVVCVGTDRVRGVAALRRSPGRGGSRAVALFFCRAAAVVSHEHEAIRRAPAPPRATLLQPAPSFHSRLV